MLHSDPNTSETSTPLADFAECWCVLPSLQRVAAALGSASCPGLEVSRITFSPAVLIPPPERNCKGKKDMKSHSPLPPPTTDELDVVPCAKKPKRKTGRKPTPRVCFMCPLVFPYKRDLIRHMQSVHDIHRSQSLMYKRINQGGEEIRRLYGQPKQVFKITSTR